MSDNTEDAKLPFPELKVTNTKPAAATNVLSQATRTYTLEGNKDVIEDNTFHIQVLSAFGEADAGTYNLNGVKVVVADVK